MTTFERNSDFSVFVSCPLYLFQMVDYVGLHVRVNVKMKYLEPTVCKKFFKFIYLMTLTFRSDAHILSPWLIFWLYMTKPMLYQKHFLTYGIKVHIDMHFNSKDLFIVKYSTFVLF